MNLLKGIDIGELDVFSAINGSLSDDDGFTYLFAGRHFDQG